MMATEEPKSTSPPPPPPPPAAAAAATSTDKSVAPTENGDKHNAPRERDVVLDDGTSRQGNMLLKDLVSLQRYLWEHNMVKRGSTEDAARRIVSLFLNGCKHYLPKDKQVAPLFLAGKGRFFRKATGTVPPPTTTTPVAAAVAATGSVKDDTKKQGIQASNSTDKNSSNMWTAVGEDEAIRAVTNMLSNPAAEVTMKVEIDNKPVPTTKTTVEEKTGEATATTSTTTDPPLAESNAQSRKRDAPGATIASSGTNGLKNEPENDSKNDPPEGPATKKMKPGSPEPAGAKAGTTAATSVATTVAAFASKLDDVTLVEVDGEYGEDAINKIIQSHGNTRFHRIVGQTMFGLEVIKLSSPSELRITAAMSILKQCENNSIAPRFSTPPRFVVKLAAPEQKSQDTNDPVDAPTGPSGTDDPSKSRDLTVQESAEFITLHLFSKLVDKDHNSAVADLKSLIPSVGDPSEFKSFLDYSKPSSVPIENPSEFDVLFGRGGMTNNHPGNRRFRDIISLHRPDYVRAIKIEKPNVARRIVAAIRGGNPPGRFLKRNPRDLKWYDVGNKHATEKTSQALREKTNAEKNGKVPSDGDVRKRLLEVALQEARATRLRLSKEQNMKSLPAKNLSPAELCILVPAYPPSTTTTFGGTAANVNFMSTPLTDGTTKASTSAVTTTTTTTTTTQMPEQNGAKSTVSTAGESSTAASVTPTTPVDAAKAAQLIMGVDGKRVLGELARNLPDKPSLLEVAVLADKQMPLDEAASEPSASKGVVDAEGNIIVTDNDILCGRGGLTNHHKGNRRFRDIVALHRPDYVPEPSVALESSLIGKNMRMRFPDSFPQRFNFFVSHFSYCYFSLIFPAAFFKHVHVCDLFSNLPLVDCYERKFKKNGRK